VRVKICRAFCCSPFSPILTEQLTCDAEAPTDTVRPRAARRISIESSTPAALDFTRFQGDPAGPGIAVGTLRRTIGNGGLDLGPLPSFTHLRAPGVAGGATRVIYAWEVLP
jgi:hypothetical protein